MEYYYLGILLILIAIDVFATRWTVDFIKSHKSEVDKVRQARIQEPTTMEINFIPRLLLGLPRWCGYAFSMVVVGGLFLAFPSEREHIFFFMLGAYLVVFQTHWANYRDLKKVPI